MLEQCCNYSKQCRNNVATLCCAKSRRCYSFRVTLLLRWFYTRRFATTNLAKQSITALLRHCFKWLQHCFNIATLCCAENRRCESSCVTLRAHFTLAAESTWARNLCVSLLKWKIRLKFRIVRILSLRKERMYPKRDYFSFFPIETTLNIEGIPEKE